MIFCASLCCMLLCCCCLMASSSALLVPLLIGIYSKGQEAPFGYFLGYTPGTRHSWRRQAFLFGDTVAWLEILREQRAEFGQQS